MVRVITLNDSSHSHLNISVSSMWALAEYSSRILNSIVLFVVGFALHGPHFMLGLIAMEAIGEQNGGIPYFLYSII